MVIMANERKINKAYGHIRTIQQAMPSYMEGIKQHLITWSRCFLCPISCTTTSKVFYRGYVPCDVLFIGEAPGYNEDALCRPFIGRPGEILDQIIMESSLRFTNNRTDNGYRWCITNTIACLPNDKGELRPPSAKEIENCQARLYQFIHIASPMLIVAMGNYAERSLKAFTHKVGTFGRKDCDEQYEWTPKIISIPHPAWMLRQKKDCDLQIKKAVLKLHAELLKLESDGV